MAISPMTLAAIMAAGSALNEMTTGREQQKRDAELKAMAYRMSPYMRINPEGFQIREASPVASALESGLMGYGLGSQFGRDEALTNVLEADAASQEKWNEELRKSMEDLKNTPPLTLDNRGPYQERTFTLGADLGSNLAPSKPGPYSLAGFDRPQKQYKFLDASGNILPDYSIKGTLPSSEAAPISTSVPITVPANLSSSYFLASGGTGGPSLFRSSSPGPYRLSKQLLIGL